MQHGQAHNVAVVQAVLGLRQRWPHWGPKKLRVKLVEHHPELPVPAASTIGEPVGIRETEGGDWLVRYADVELGYIHSQRGRLSPRPLRGVIKPGDLMDIADAITTTPQAQPPQHP